MFFKPEIVVINHSDHTLEIEVIEIMRSNVGSLIVSYRDITFSYSRSYVQSTTQPISAGRHIFSPGCHTICPAKRNCTYQVNIFKVNATRIRKKILLKNEVWTITNESLDNLECHVQPIVLAENKSDVCVFRPFHDLYEQLLRNNQSIGFVALVMVLAYCISTMRNYLC